MSPLLHKGDEEHGKSGMDDHGCRFVRGIRSLSFSSPPQSNRGVGAATESSRSIYGRRFVGPLAGRRAPASHRFLRQSADGSASIRCCDGSASVGKQPVVDVAGSTTYGCHVPTTNP